MVDDRLAEGIALLRIGERGIERCLRDTHRLRRDADATAVERRQRDLQPFAGSAEHVLLRYLEIVEHDLAGVAGAMTELLLAAGDDIARRVGPSHEAGDPVLAGGGIRHRDDHGDARALASGDEILGAAKNETAVPLLGTSPEIAGVGAGLRLAQQERRHGFAGRQRSEKALLLVVVSKSEQRRGHREFVAAIMLDIPASPRAISSIAAT